ncbi:MAG: uroporphyrinogen decarboxylase family protein [Armatimonadota bacterium]
MMTSKERILKTIQHETPDRVPVSPFTLGALDYASPMAQELIRKTDPFVRIVTGDEQFTGSLAIPRVQVDGDFTTLTYDTPKGPLTTRHQRTPIMEGTVEFAFRSHDDVDRFMAMPFSPIPIDMAPYRKWCDRIGDGGMVLMEIQSAICLPGCWFSPEDFCLWWADSPDTILELTRIASERVIDHVHGLCHAGVDGFRIVGGELVTVQLGPRAFDSLVTPFDSELIDVMHAHGAVVYYHNHGPMAPCLDKLANLGMDMLDPLEAAPWGDVEIGDAVRRVSDRICLVGNLDDMEIINALPTAEVLDIAEERLASAGNSGFILGGTASGTYTEHGARNFIAMADMVSKAAQ